MELSEDQSSKSKSGWNFKTDVNNILNQLLDNETIKSFEAQKNLSHKGFSYDKQYLMNYVIKTVNDKFIIVCGTRSFRSDRVKSSYYDIIGFIENWEYSHDIIASIIVVDDAEKNESHFKSERDRITNKVSFCPATHLFTLSEFESFLSEFYASVESEKLETTEIRDGSYYGKSGNDFERSIVSLLNDKREFEKFYHDENDVKELFKLIVDKLLLDWNKKKFQLELIEATNTITLLKNGGSPKSDVKVLFHFEGGELLTTTLSLKLTTKNNVSCHDYPFERFVKVMNCAGTIYEEYFKVFQIEHSHERFVEKLGKEAQSDFAQFLEKNLLKFCEWVLTGKHDNENLSVQEEQIPKYILIQKNGKYHFASMDDYIERLILFSKTKKFPLVVPFRWTYPSGSGGKRIQLKVPIIGF
jgi:hypothetical protein